MDNDVFLYRDVYPILAVGYQFVTRWTNLHVLRLHKHSLLSKRAMRLAISMPMNHPHFKQEIIGKCCKAVAYIQVRLHKGLWCGYVSINDADSACEAACECGYLMPVSVCLPSVQV